MIFCLLIEFLILLFILIDILKIIKKDSCKKILNKCEMYLLIILIMCFIVMAIGDFDTLILSWLNQNSDFYFIYLVTALIWTILEGVKYFRS